MTNDFFVNLLDMNTVWSKSASDEDVYEGRDRKTGKVKWTGHQLILCSAPIHSSGHWLRFMDVSDSQEKFIHDFIAVWSKVMNLDRFDLA